MLPDRRIERRQISKWILLIGPHHLWRSHCRVIAITVLLAQPAAVYACQSPNSRSLNIYRAWKVDHIDVITEDAWKITAFERAMLQNTAIVDRAHHLPEDEVIMTCAGGLTHYTMLAANVWAHCALSGGPVVVCAITHFYTFHCM